VRKGYQTIFKDGGVQEESHVSWISDCSFEKTSKI